MTVFCAEAVWNHAQLNKAQTLIQMPCMNICFHHRIELQNAESMQACLNYAVRNELFAYVTAAQILFYGIACI